MENSHQHLPTRAQIVSEQASPSPYDTPRWVTPRRDVDWDAVDFRWIGYHRDREVRAGGFLKGVRYRLHPGMRWLRLLVQRGRGQ